MNDNAKALIGAIIAAPIIYFLMVAVMSL